MDLGNATVEEFPADEEKVEVVAEKLKDILTGIRSGDFEVSHKKEHCAKCDYSGICRFCDGGSSPPAKEKGEAVREFHFINREFPSLAISVRMGHEMKIPSLFLGYNKLVPAHVEPEYLG